MTASRLGRGWGPGRGVKLERGAGLPGAYQTVADERALDALRGFLIDLDGVVYTGRAVVRGAPELFPLLRERGLPFLLLTNNSSRSAEQVAAGLARMGIEVQPSEILTSAEATGEFLAAHIDMQTRRTAPFAPHIAQNLDRILAEHSALNWAAPVSGAIDVR